MKGLSVGTAYSIWVGVGAVGTVILGILLLGESASVSRMISVVPHHRWHHRSQDFNGIGDHCRKRHYISLRSVFANTSQQDGLYGLDFACCFFNTLIASDIPIIWLVSQPAGKFTDCNK
jgi:Small Multidrug Resistance protein